MNVKNILSYLSSLLKTDEFEIDIVKLSEIADLSEEEFENELIDLQTKNDIEYSNNTVKLINIKPKKNKKFNDLYNPVETFEWTQNMKLVFDK